MVFHKTILHLITILTAALLGASSAPAQQPLSPEQIVELRAKATRGDAEAQNTLGDSYATGEGVTQDDSKALKWYRKAAVQGNAKAQFTLGFMYDIGKGVKTNNAEAQNNVGVMYRDGEGVPKDLAEAVKWCGKAAELGLAEAQNNLGLMYKDGHGVPQDYVLAYKWCLVGSAQGYELAKRSCAILERTMTPEQRAEGERRAREFKPTPAK